MPPVRISRVISVSSEDTIHKAENLLNSDVCPKSWRCKSPGEKQAVILLGFDKSYTINSLDLGNDNSAFVEISVGRSAMPDNFEVLLMNFPLMTVQDAKNGKNKSSVFFFNSDKLIATVTNESWDRVKIVCSQPFNKDSQYGLSFIRLYSNVKSPEANTKIKMPDSLGTFKLKDDKDDDIITSGSFFAKRKELSAAAAIRDASTNSNLLTSQKKESPIVKKKAKRESQPCSEILPKIKESRRVTEGSLFYYEDDIENINGNKTPKNIANLVSIENKLTICDATNFKKQGVEKDVTTKKVDVKEILRRPFDTLLKGVIFVISGYQNPLRSEIRSKGLQMGAKYSGDWDSSCTHLICAFENTPKYNQVKGKGYIVNKNWIEDCYKERKKLLVKKYLLDTNDSFGLKHDQEIYEEDGGTNSIF